MPLLSVRPQFKPISLQTSLDPPFFAFCSPHPAGLTQLDSGFNIQFLEIQFLRCPEGIEYLRHRAVHPRHQCRGFSRWIGKVESKECKAGLDPSFFGLVLELLRGSDKKLFVFSFSCSTGGFPLD